jgi:hypothetical protein|tara:strand:+ start:124 stop:486 length:363 start_codon:yes stop_codon:yes gene_type:complete
MQTFKLFQIKLSDADVDLINAKGHDAVPHHKAKLDMQFSKSIASKAGKAIADGYYSHVANITADTLEGVFHVGNMGPEENIERLNEMHSVSVADVVQDSNGIMHVVADFGFEKVDIAVEA